jgi:cobalamin biosynthesis protein CobT
VEKKSEIIENFKVAISSTVKSLSNSENIEISFGNQNYNSKKNSMKLPEPEKIKDKINYSQIRAIADSKSLKLRFSDNKTLKLYEPNGNISKKLYMLGVTECDTHYLLILLPAF